MGVQDPLWPDCRKLLADSNALAKRMAHFDKDNVSAARLAHVRQFTRGNFSLEDVCKNSVAAGSFAAWAFAIDYYCLRKELSDQPLFEVDLGEVDSTLRSLKNGDMRELAKVRQAHFLGIFCLQAVALLLRGQKDAPWEVC